LVGLLISGRADIEIISYETVVVIVIHIVLFFLSEVEMVSWNFKNPG